jgi:hypothetical protein
MKPDVRIKNNISGQKFNKLLVVEVMPRDLGDKTKYLCKCECGNQVIVDGSKIKNGHTKSCGCLRNEHDYGSHSRGKFGDSSKNALIASYKANSKRKNIKFNLTNSQMEDLFKSNCFYCGTEPKNIYSRERLYGHYVYNGIDRKNNDLGYIESNVVSCCSQCNYIKHKFNYDDFLNWINTVYNNLLKNENIS